MTERNVKHSDETKEAKTARRRFPFGPLSGKGRRFLLALIDIAWLCLMFLLVLFFADKEAGGGMYSIRTYWRCLLVIAVCIMAGRLLVRAYANIWRYPNVTAYMTMLVSDTVSGMIAYIINRNLHEKVTGIHIGFWQTFCVMALFALGTLSMRFSYQLVHARLNENGGRLFRPTAERENRINIAIVGAGQMGQLLAEQLNCNPESHYKPYCFVDIDPIKIGSTLCGLRVYDEKDGIVERLQSMPVQEIFIALPKLPAEALTALCDMYSRTGCKVKVCSEPREPGLIRSLTEEDYVSLLGRDALKVNDDATRAFYRDKTVLVTGGGGSIGSELCRQIMRYQPRRLLIFDIYENCAYELETELRNKYGAEAPVITLIGSIRDKQRLDEVFETYHPSVVFHAAAHKHVPLMEISPAEAVKNNVFGTKNLLTSAAEHGVERFVQLSTDKAVNPTNVMGCTKRLCEMLIQSFASGTDMKCVAVRFGNVLGSHGSVIPLFEEQIKRGGPVTITHPDIVRYFMTITEAAQLVLQAGGLAKGGSIYVLDMGEPVKIMDLANRLIRFYGYEPGVNMQVKITGLRPGEKLYEELLMDAEQDKMLKTAHNKIFIAPPMDIDLEKFYTELQELKASAQHNDDAVVECLQEMVPSYHPNRRVRADHTVVAASGNTMILSREELEKARKLHDEKGD